MSKKSDSVKLLLKKIPLRAPLPKPLKEGTLLEQGLLAVLVRHLSQSEAEAMLGKLKKLYPDWNEMRVSQAQELASLVMTGERRADAEAVRALYTPLRDAREWLQEVFQKTHGFDLEFMRDDLPAAQKLVTQMNFLGLAAGTYLLWLASNKDMPVHNALVRVLDRLGLVSRAQAKKVKEAIKPIAPEGDELQFAAAFSEVAQRWCHSAKPLCHECPLVDDCVFGKKAFQEWKTQQARMEAHRQKEEARRAILEKKEAEKRAKEDTRARVKAEAETARVTREREKLKQADQKRKEAEAKQKQKVEASAKKVAQEAARKAVEEAKKAAADKKKAQEAAKVAAKAAKAKAAAAKKAPAKPKPKSKSAKKKR